jgi:hypothetical protein
MILRIYTEKHKGSDREGLEDIDGVVSHAPKNATSTHETRQRKKD